jgi:hypothetical protein
VVAPDWWIREAGLDSGTAHYRDELRVSVAAIRAELGIGGELDYCYDMGDDWTHRIVIEAPPEPLLMLALRLPTCTAGGLATRRMPREQRLTSLAWQRDEAKMRRRVEIVLPGVIDDSQVSIPRGGTVFYDEIDFAALQVFTPAIVEANHETCCSVRSHSRSVEEALDFELAAPDPVGFVPM